MRALFLALMLAAPAVAAPGPAAMARGLADDQLAPASLAWAQRGDGALASRQFDVATDAYEAALAADPRNRNAFIGLARVAEAQGLPGKAIRLYREALQIEPNDIAALEGQSVALARRGATERAKANLERIRVLCAGPCAAATRVTAAIARGADPVVTADASKAASPPVPGPVAVPPSQQP